jgi:hypothetical protein
MVSARRRRAFRNHLIQQGLRTQQAIGVSIANDLLLPSSSLQDRLLYCQQNLEEELDLFTAAAAVVTGSREYIYHGLRVPTPPSYYKSQIRRHWRPESLPVEERELQKEEHLRAYNKLQHFRVTYEIFQYIKKAIADEIRHEPSPVGGPKPLSPGEQLACCLWWLAQGGEYRAIATGAHRSRSTIHRCVVRVCAAIRKVLGPIHIKFPKTTDELKAAVSTEPSTAAGHMRQQHALVGELAAAAAAQQQQQQPCTSCQPHT